MSRLVSAGMAAALLLVALPATVPASGPEASASRGCSIRCQEDDLGATYVITLTGSTSGAEARLGSAAS